VFSVGEGPGAPSPNPNIRVTKPAIVPEEPLRAEIRAFLEAVRTRKDPRVGLEDGRRALAVALEILDQIVAHAGRLGLRASG
jgi:predicted dehydrogenase